MVAPMADGRSTPSYLVIFFAGVLVGSAIRLVVWALPSDVIERTMERLLP